MTLPSCSVTVHMTNYYRNECNVHYDNKRTIFSQYFYYTGQQCLVRVHCGVRTHCESSSAERSITCSAGSRYSKHLMGNRRQLWKRMWMRSPSRIFRLMFSTDKLSNILFFTLMLRLAIVCTRLKLYYTRNAPRHQLREQQAQAISRSVTLEALLVYYTNL